MDPQTIKEKLEAKRAGFDDEGVWMRFLIDSYTGGGGFQGRVRQQPSGFWGAASEAYASYSILRSLSQSSAGPEKDTYLDRYPREDGPKFKRRRDVVHYLNYVKPTTNLKISYIVRKPHQRNNVPDRLAKWIEDSGWDKDFRRRALVTAVLGWYPMMVDMPRAPDGAGTAAQAGNMDPYAVLSLPCCLVDYLTDDAGKLAWAKMCTRVKVRPSWDAPCVETNRYTIWTPTDFTIYEVTGEHVSAPVTNPHSFGQVPIVFWRADTSVEDPVKADSLNADVALEGRRLFNILSELDEHIRSQVFALLVWPSRGTTPTGGAEVGVANGVQIDAEQKNVPYYLSPDASVAATLEKAIERTIIEIYRMARVEYTKASGTGSSAQSKQEEFAQTNLAIVDFAVSLAHADRDTLILVGRGLGISEDQLQKIECVAHQSYADEELQQEIDQVMSALTVRMLGPTFRKVILIRLAQRMLPNLTSETRAAIEAEISDEVLEDDQAEEAMEGEPASGELPGGADSEGGTDTSADAATPKGKKPATSKPPISFHIVKDANGGITVKEQQT